MHFKERASERIEMRLYLKEGTYNTLCKIISGAIITSPNFVTLTLYQFERETNMGYGNEVMLLRLVPLKVILFDVPESSIHKLVLDSKYLHKGSPKSMEEVQITVPAKFIGPALEFGLLYSSPACSIRIFCKRLIICPYYSFVMSMLYRLPCDYSSP